MNFGKVGVLYGGRSAEREVSLMTGTGVLAALKSKGVDAHGFDTGRQSLVELAAAGFERVFIALHGRYGEDGSLQGALELLGIPYTGSGVTACAVASDKVFAKRIWSSMGLPTPRYEALDVTMPLIGVSKRLGLPLMVKPPLEGSTIGITKVEDGPDVLGALQRAVAIAARLDPNVLIEQFVRGRELTVAILGERALPVIEIQAPGGNYDYQNKYFSDDTRYLCPAPLDAGLAERIGTLAHAAFRALGCEGWGRVDIMLDARDQPWLLEVNTAPGMTGHSLVPMAARAVGMSYEDLCVQILAGARLKMAGNSAGNTAGKSAGGAH